MNICKPNTEKTPAFFLNVSFHLQTKKKWPSGVATSASSTYFQCRGGDCMPGMMLCAIIESFPLTVPAALGARHYHLFMEMRTKGLREGKVTWPHSHRQGITGMLRFKSGSRWFSSQPMSFTVGSTGSVATKAFKRSVWDTGSPQYMFRPRAATGAYVSDKLKLSKQSCPSAIRTANFTLHRVLQCLKQLPDLYFSVPSWQPHYWGHRDSGKAIDLLKGSPQVQIYRLGVEIVINAP